jgi:TonB family protein
LTNDGSAERRDTVKDRETLLVTTLVAAVTVLGAATLLAEEPVRYDETTMSEPKVIHKVAPQYPGDAKEEGVQGAVVLEAVIAEDGSVRETRTVRGEDSRLVEAARAAVGQWRFEPIKDEEGKPMELLFTITVRFALS